MLLKKIWEFIFWIRHLVPRDRCKKWTRVPYFFALASLTCLVSACVVIPLNIWAPIRGPNHATATHPRGEFPGRCTRGGRAYSSKEGAKRLTEGRYARYHRRSTRTGSWNSRCGRKTKSFLTINIIIMAFRRKFKKSFKKRRGGKRLSTYKMSRGGIRL